MHLFQWYHAEQCPVTLIINNVAPIYYNTNHRISKYTNHIPKSRKELISMQPNQITSLVQHHIHYFNI